VLTKRLTKGSVEHELKKDLVSNEKAPQVNTTSQVHGRLNSWFRNTSLRQHTESSYKGGFPIRASPHLGPILRQIRALTAGNSLRHHPVFTPEDKIPFFNRIDYVASQVGVGRTISAASGRA